MAPIINSIIIGSGGEPAPTPVTPWAPNPLWPDLKQIIDDDTEDYVGKVAILLTDRTPQSSIVLSSLRLQAIKTSDGSFYTENGTHTWDKLQDIDDGTMIKKRWVILYYDTQSSLSVISSIFELGEPVWIVIGSQDPLVPFTWNYNSNFSYSTSNFSLESIQYHNNAIMKTNSMNSKFENCISLEEIPLIDTEGVTSFQKAFFDCHSLKTIPLLNTSSTVDASYMFYNNYGLLEIPLLDTSEVDNMNYMFYGCSELKTIPLLDTSKVSNMNYMFNGCTNLESIPLLDTSGVGGMAYMFASSGITEIPELDMSEVTTTASMFYYAIRLKEIVLPDLPKLTDASSMFRSTRNLISCKIGNMPLLPTITQMFNFSNVMYVELGNTPLLTSAINTFDSAPNLMEVVGLDFSTIVSMDDLFDGCKNLYKLPEINLTAVEDVYGIDVDTFDFGENFSSTVFEPIDITFTPNTINVSFSMSTPRLSHDSLISLIAGLADRSALSSKSVVLGATNLSLLSQAEKVRITSTNWT